MTKRAARAGMPTCSECGEVVQHEGDLVLTVFAGRTLAHHRRCERQRRHELNQAQTHNR